MYSCKLFRPIAYTQHYEMAGNSPEEWYKGLPIITRAGVTCIFVVTVLVTMGIVDPYLLVLDWTMIVSKFHVWRLMSCVLFFGPFSMQWMFQMYFFTSFGTKLENNEIFSSPGDYPFFVAFQILCLSIISVFLSWPNGIPLLGPSLVFAMIYYWSRREPYAQLSFFSFQIQGFQFPFVLMFFGMLMGNPIWNDLLGLASAHLYYFLKEVCPQEYGKTFIWTPRFMTNFFYQLSISGASSASANLYAGAGNAPPPPPTDGPAHFTGAGHRLGGN